MELPESKKKITSKSDGPIIASIIFVDPEVSQDKRGVEMKTVTAKVFHEGEGSGESRWCDWWWLGGESVTGWQDGISFMGVRNRVADRREGRFLKGRFLSSSRFWGECLQTECLGSPEFKCWNLIPNVTVLGGGPFGWWLGHEGGVSWMQLGPLLRTHQRAPSLLLSCEHTDRHHLWIRKQSLQENCRHFDLGLSLQNGEK